MLFFFTCLAHPVNAESVTMRGMAIFTKFHEDTGINMGMSFLQFGKKGLSFYSTIVV